MKSFTFVSGYVFKLINRGKILPDAEKAGPGKNSYENPGPLSGKPFLILKTSFQILPVVFIGSNTVFGAAA